MSIAQPLQISCTTFELRFPMVVQTNTDRTDIELQMLEDHIEFIEVILPSCRRSIRPRSKNLFREEFPQPLTVEGEAFSFSVHKKKWYSKVIPVVKVVRINVNDVLSNSREQKFQTVRNKLDITIGLSPCSTPVGDSAPTNTGVLRPTTEDLLKECPRFRVLVIGQSGVGKSTLIRQAFGIEEAVAKDDKPGEADIGKELTSWQNDRFVLHDSKGFEPAEHNNYSSVKKLCFQTPLVSNGERLTEGCAERLLQEDMGTIGDIPTIVVFTKYDRLLDSFQLQGVDKFGSAAEEYLEQHCIKPIQLFTGNSNLTHLTVSCEFGEHRQGLEELIELTHKKVVATFGSQLGTPSPVSVVTQMAQRVSPRLKIEGSITVGKQRYWRALTSGANFGDHTILECLAVIHTDIVSVWNFNDPSQYLYSTKFRALMIKLVETIDSSAPPLPHTDTTSNICELGAPLLLAVPIILPFKAGLGLAQWVHETYQRLPEVHRKFMAYVVDLVHILEILFALTANNNEKKLSRGAISLAFNAYYTSTTQRDAQRKIMSRDYIIPGRDAVLDEIISLVGMSAVDDRGIARALADIPPAALERDDKWFNVADNPHSFDR
ncbi:hypothetical protein F5J12DRAFT_898167 [Pisolithus orientalis]|uniref:uncharacterized protein n=1 Tax=Pisolithus orientalis TaxID=936130 RepID=UPI0022241B1A|nr:uncharacterized protein F5J12DRAFT_898167 [Pisolithus orientalis]KAI5988483.1 hypothetical protein F5J12DRAFT_898167 [Pisolithus orientalis]